MLIEYSRTRNNVIPPTRANPSDAGLDVYFNPEHSGSTTLNPGESKRLQTGLRFGIPHGFMLQVMNRSSVASKCNLIVGAQVVDSGFNGEVFVDMHNIGDTLQVIESGAKIAQVVMIPVVPFRAIERPDNNLYDWHPITISNRDIDALGSTGR